MREDTSVMSSRTRQIWDISRPLANDLAPWPGDTDFRFKLTCPIGAVSPVNVGAISMSVHNGTHADAPFHFSNDGRTIETMPLHNYIGPAVVVDLSAKFSSRRGTILIADLQPAERHIRKSRRLLIKTNCFPDITKFPDWIPVLAPETVEWLGEMQLNLLGVDVPSVDPIDSKELSNHHVLRGNEIVIIESLDLKEIESGTYNLAALPLRVVGGDAAPVRAVLWRA